jgi:hypothetical protein
MSKKPVINPYRGPSGGRGRGGRGATAATFEHLIEQGVLTKGNALEKRLAAGPVITVPIIKLEGDANGAPHPEPALTRTSHRNRCGPECVSY